MSDDTQQPIVVKRIKKGGGGAHGGAWKIAYADFVTAMMAFFLLMWLLGSTAQGDLQGIAEFFQNPLKVSMAGGSGSGDSSSILNGGGEDLTRSVGQVKRGDVEAHKTINLDAAKAQGRGDELPGSQDAEDSEEAKRESAERARLIDLKGQIEALVEASPNLREFRSQLLMDITTEGLRIQIVDQQNRPMFDSASDQFKPYTRQLLQEIGRALNGVSNAVSLAGHTDATQYAGGQRGFSNWELSANRANASRRELVAGGLEAEKVIRVVGLADMYPFDPAAPDAPTNRRISILVLNKKAEAAIRGEQGGVDVPGERPLDAPDFQRDIERGATPAEPAAAPEPPSRDEEYIPRFRRNRLERSS
jgi:chemotaxis protein MotB